MVVRWVGLLLICAILCTGIASADLTPDILTISTDKPEGWIVANNVDTATITVRALNQTNGSFGVAGVEISFSLTDATLGTIAAPENVLTDSEGYAHAVMTVKNKSGIATINARNSTLNATTSLKIFAPYPDETNITSSADWLVANGSDRGTITVSAFNTTSSRVPIAGLNVTFSVNASIFGAVNPITVQTDSQGNASTVFTTGKKSGVAVISGNLTPLVNGVPYILLNISQKIDHDNPYRISDYNYTNEIEVGDIKPFAFTFSDRWGNLIDNRRIAENVSISITSPSPVYNASLSLDNSTFSTNVVIPVNGAGITAGLVRMNTRPGWNIFIIHPLMFTPAGEQAIPDKYLTIEGIPTKPVRIEAEFYPSNFRQYADGESKFHINYTMWDKYGNFVQNRSLYVETSIPGEERQVGTNAEGVAMLTYGPKSSIGSILITATAMDNETLQHRQQVWFVSQEPTDMLLTATPQSMPSFDVPPGTTADVMARVVDELGNPVENEAVTFSIDTGSIHYDPTDANVTAPPSLSSDNALTDSDGYAIVQFTPGSFYTNGTDNTRSATGRCDVLASWGAKTRSVPLSWKNYPYISLSSSVSESVVMANTTIDVTITIVGDGYKLQPNPIDVILCTDRSGSMLYDNPDRMHSVREAAKQFVDNMSETRDRVGLVTFGRNGDISRPGVNSGISTSEIDNIYVYPRSYYAYATLDKTLTNDFPSVKQELDSIVPDHGTPMREGLRLSIQNLSKYDRTNAVKGIILLSDGDYNWYGDPLARGSGGTSSPTDYGDLTNNYYLFDDLASWSGRWNHTSVVMSDGSIVLSGGRDSSGRKNDVWRSTNGGATWIRVNASAGWSVREGHTSVAMSDGSIILSGGRDNSNRRNDVWRSTNNGATWTRMTANAGWSARNGHSSVAMSDGSTVLMGGNDGSRKRDVWRSTNNGMTWTQMTSSAGWSAREGHTSVAMSDGSIVLMGGYNSTHRMNDVWRSINGGVTWTQMTSSAGWSARFAHTSVAMPDGSIVLMGGRDSTGRKNDVWRSTDNGATWTQMTASAGWSAREGHTSVAMSDGSIVLMGGNDGSRKYDVWRSADNGATWTRVVGEGQFSNQNMSVYAINNNIAIYSIAFADQITSGGRYTLATLANSSGGKYYEADASNIVDVYKAIARDLQTTAGVNTSVTMQYGEIKLDYTPIAVNDSVMKYIYSPNNSTYVNSYMTTDGSHPSHTPTYPYTINQTTEWNSEPRQLYFDIGTIYLDQVWEAKYRLQLVKPGLYDIFNPASVVSFNNGTESLSFPDLYVTAIANMTNTNVTTNLLQYLNVTEVTGMTGPESELFRTFNISSTYTSTMNVTEEYYIVTYDGRRWFMGSRILTPEEANQERQFRIRVTDLPAGWRYLDPVANVFDAPGPARIPPVPMNPPQMNPNKVYINLT